MGAASPTRTLPAHWLIRVYCFFRWNAVIRPKLARMDMGGVFTEIYKLNRWGNRESLSGVGSTLDATEVVRSELPRLIRALNIKSMIDIPCGDFNWMKLVDLPVAYLGADIVPDLIARNNATYSDGARSFRTLNLVSDPLPRTDLVVCRDCLIHLSFADIKTALANIKQSGSTYLLTSTYVELDHNDDIVTGEFRTINLQRPPFSFPDPLMSITERSDPQRPDKTLGLWRVADIP